EVFDVVGIITDFRRNTDPNAVVTTFGHDQSGAIALGPTISGGNALQFASSVTGVLESDIITLNNDNITYDFITDTSIIDGPITADFSGLRSNPTGMSLITDSLISIDLAPEPRFITNLSGTTTLNLSTGLLDLGSTNSLQNVINLNPIGAFYEAGTLPYDESESIADLTPRLFNDETAVQPDDLAALDTNSDGVIDSSDTDFDNLKVWNDVNEDGAIDSPEMQTLDDAGISSIPLNDSALVFTAGNGDSVVAQDVDALESSLQVSDPTASTPTIGFDYYRNAFDQVRAIDGHVWLSSEIKFTDDNQYAVGTTGDDAFFTNSAPYILGGDGNDNL
ncbi:MAG: hypothetical protein L0287_27255, partial [Anaerolineae bacterium]|nr:hypothetical protein [Anaerolineae bacterium]